MPVPESVDPFGALLLLVGTICILGASLVVCYMIWSAGWEGWESWNARTGLNDEEASLARQERLARGSREPRD